jgi:predicted nucleic acid-binding protein
LAYLFDTDTLSNLIRCAPKSSLVSRLACVPPGEQFTSSVTFGESIRGALRSGRSGLLLEQIEAVIPAMLAVLPFDGVAAQRYGEVRAGLEKEGHAYR